MHLVLLSSPNCYNKESALNNVQARIKQMSCLTHSDIAKGFNKLSTHTHTHTQLYCYLEPIDRIILFYIKNYWKKRMQGYIFSIENKHTHTHTKTLAMLEKRVGEIEKTQDNLNKDSTISGGKLFTLTL